MKSLFSDTENKQRIVISERKTKNRMAPCYLSEDMRTGQAVKGEHPKHVQQSHPAKKGRSEDMETKILESIVQGEKKRQL